jgi:hypothetical protein
MTRSWEVFALAVCLGSGLAVVPAARAGVPAAGWLLRQVPTPDVVEGDVVATPSGALLVGQGGFGPGQQSIVRLDAAGATVIAEGFGSLGGFALGDDGTLYVVDNCYVGDFGCDGATTGDTVYAIPDALGRTDAMAAADAELLPAGSIPEAFDVLVAPTLGLLVSDATGPGAGRVLRVGGGAATTFLGGFDFTAGIAIQGDRLLVGNSDARFVGSIRSFQNGSVPGVTLVDGLSGAFGVEASTDDVFVTGGFTPDFSSSTIVAVDAAGEAREIASGFAFTGGLDWEPQRREVYALDFGVRAIAVLCEDASGDGACDAACPVPRPARTRARVALAADGTPPVVTIDARLRLARGDRPDPSVTGVAVGVTGADGTVVADWRVPGGAGWERRRRRWTWRGDGHPVSEVTVRRGRRRLAIRVSGQVPALPAGAFATSVALGGAGGSCARGDFDGLVAVGR